MVRQTGDIRICTQKKLSSVKITCSQLHVYLLAPKIVVFMRLWTRFLIQTRYETQLYAMAENYSEE